MNRVPGHLPGNCYMMAFMAFEFFWIINGKHLLVTIGDYDHLGAFFNAFFRALGGLGVCAFGAALGIGNVAVDSSVVGGKRYTDEHEHDTESKTDQQQLSHGEYLLNSCGCAAIHKASSSCRKTPCTEKGRVGQEANHDAPEIYHNRGLGVVT